MNTQDLIVYTIVFLCVLRIGKHFYRVIRCKHNGCCTASGCSGCPLSQQCKHPKEERTKPQNPRK